MQIAVVILNYNGRHFLEQFLEGVVRHSNQDTVTVYVADNGSTDTSVAYLKENQSSNKISKAPKINMDNRDFGIGAQILHDLNIHKLSLVSNTKQTKRVGLIGYGLEIVDYINY